MGLGLILFSTQAQQDNDPNNFNGQKLFRDTFSEKLGILKDMSADNSARTAFLCDDCLTCIGLGLQPYIITYLVKRHHSVEMSRNYVASGSLALQWILINGSEGYLFSPFTEPRMSPISLYFKDFVSIDTSLTNKSVGAEILNAIVLSPFKRIAAMLIRIVTSKRIAL
ncbi:hypothetical protein TNCV_1557401 [Trichonephila clavipes]|nr:hypothetical protein TNCV_1557401 [Trichonephila clavipes]